MLGVAKQFLSRAITELSSKTQFAILFGGPESGRFTRFPASGKPVEATDVNKLNAASFLAGAPVAGTPSIQADLTAALRSAEQLPSARKTIIYVTKGVIIDNTAENILREVAVENRQHVKIDVIGVEPDAGGEAFLKALASQNGGTYRRVD